MEQKVKSGKNPHWKISKFACLNVLVLAAVASLAAPVSADLFDYFELSNGTADGVGQADINGSPQIGPDWEDIFDADGNLKDSDGDGISDVREVWGGVAAVFVQDDIAPGSLEDDTVFPTGSNKVTDNISDWVWGTKSVPTKDDLSNVYSYATLDNADNLIIYVGMERITPSGASYVDIELNQKNIDLDKEPPCGDDLTGGPGDDYPCEFTGEKTIGDLLIVMSFDQGGSLTSVEIRTWDGSDYVLVEDLTEDPTTETAEGCNQNETICMFSNDVEIWGGPWVNFDNHGDEIENIPARGFVEVGINVSAFMDADPCITGVMVKSRSSPSYSSELKDFAFEQFDICAINVTKTGDNLSKAGDNVTYTINITNTGAIDLYKREIWDSLVDNLTNNDSYPAIISHNCGDSLDALESCTITLTREVQGADPDPLVNIVTVDYSSQAANGMHLNASDNHSVKIVHPNVTVTKTGDECSKEGDDITYNITICNTGDIELLKNSIVDDLLGDLTGYYKSSLAVDECESQLFTHTVTALEAEKNSLNNTVEVLYKVGGGTNLPNNITDSDKHTVIIVHPNITVTKTGDKYSKKGDNITYNITICNTGDIVLLPDSIVDDLLGDLTASYDSLAVDDCEWHLFTHTVTALEAEKNSLNNTVEVHYDVGCGNLPNDINASDNWTTTILHPNVSVVKTGDEYAKYDWWDASTGEIINYTITINNTGDADLVNGVIVDPNAVLDIPPECYNLAVGDDCTITGYHEVTMDEGKKDYYLNTVYVNYSLHERYELDNIIWDLDKEDDTWNTTILHPNVSVTKEGDNYSKYDYFAGIGDIINYTITINNTGDATLVNPVIVDPNANLTYNPDCDVLNPDDKCVITGYHIVNYEEGLEEYYTNTVYVNYSLHEMYKLDNIIWDLDTEDDTWNTIILHPNFTVNKSCLNESGVPAGANAYFNVTICNTGDCNLSFTASDDEIPPFSLEPGDCRSFEVNQLAMAPPVVFNEVIVNATLPDYDLPNVITKEANDTCDVIGSATRTLGFWKTHYNYSTHVFEDHLNGSIDLGWKVVNSSDDLFGIFWANNAFNSDDTRRSKLCQARVTVSKQALAAILNSGLDNGAPLPPGANETEIAAILSGTNVKAIRDLGEVLDDYNKQWDDIAIIDYDGTEVVHADPNTARDVANVSFADCDTTGKVKGKR